MSWLSRQMTRLRGGAPVADPPEPDRPADPNDPAVATVMRIIAEAGTLPEDQRLEEDLAAAKAAYEAAPDAEKPALMGRVAELSLRKAAAREARKKYHG